MNHPAKDSVEYLLTWLKNQAKPFIKKHAEDKIASIELDEEKLKGLNKNKDQEISVCFLGATAIGKSTLLNILVSDDAPVVPSGGTGPLTAQAIEVFYSERPFFEVEYHGFAELNRVRFAIATKAQVMLKAINEESNNNLSGQVEVQAGILADAAEVKAEILADAVVADAAVADTAVADAAVDKDSLVIQANLIVRGEQAARLPLKYLEVALSSLSEQQPVEAIVERLLEAKNSLPSVESTEYLSDSNIESDAGRIHRLRNILRNRNNNRNHKQFLEQDKKKAFHKDLHDHAAGFLSPLIKKIKVGWHSDFLKNGVKLVDLPGIGTGRDSYRKVAENYVSSQARAIVMVVDRGGPTAVSIDLLHTSGYWNRLIASAYDPGVDPATMLLAVTRVDDVANEMHANEAYYNDNANDDNDTRLSEIFLQLCAELKVRMRQQVTDQLSANYDNYDDEQQAADETLQEARNKAKENVLKSLQIHPVSAPQMRELILKERGGKVKKLFLQEPTETGIPGLRESLIKLAKDEQKQRDNKIRELSKRITFTAVNELKIIQQSFSDDRKTDEEIEKIRVFLEQKRQPIQNHYNKTRTEFRSYLKETIPAKIEVLVTRTQVHAKKEAQGYLNKLKNVRWKTLDAAVRHGGTFSGMVRTIDLPGEITDSVHESIAANWGKYILIDMRDRTTKLIGYIKGRVDELCSEAEQLGVSPELLATQKDRLDSLREQMKAFGEDAVSGMHDIVKIMLKDILRDQVATACRNFQATGKNQGKGAAERIRQLFKELAMQSIEEIEDPVAEFLKHEANKVTEKIEENFSSLGNPLQQTVDLILQKRQNMSEEHRRHVLDEADYIISAVKEHLLEYSVQSN